MQDAEMMLHQWEDMGLVLHCSWNFMENSLSRVFCRFPLQEELHECGEEEQWEDDAHWEAIHYDWVWVHT